MSNVSSSHRTTPLLSWFVPKIPCDAFGHVKKDPPPLLRLFAPRLHSQQMHTIPYAILPLVPALWYQSFELVWTHCALDMVISSEPTLYFCIWSVPEISLFSGCAHSTIPLFLTPLWHVAEELFKCRYKVICQGRKGISLPLFYYFVTYCPFIQNQ